MLWLEYVGVLAIPADVSARSIYRYIIWLYKSNFSNHLVHICFYSCFLFRLVAILHKRSELDLSGVEAKKGELYHVGGPGEAAARLAEESPQVVFWWPRGLGQEVPIGTPFKKQGKSGKYNYITNMHDIFFWLKGPVGWTRSDPGCHGIPSHRPISARNKLLFSWDMVSANQNCATITFLLAITTLPQTKMVHRLSDRESFWRSKLIVQGPGPLLWVGWDGARIELIAVTTQGTRNVTPPVRNFHRKWTSKGGGVKGPWGKTVCRHEGWHVTGRDRKFGEVLWSLRICFMTQFIWHLKADHCAGGNLEEIGSKLRALWLTN